MAGSEGPAAAKGTAVTGWTAVTAEGTAAAQGTALVEATAAPKGTAVTEGTAVADETAVPEAAEGTEVAAVVLDEAEAAAKGVNKQPLVAECEVMHTAKDQSSKDQSRSLQDLRIKVRVQGFRRALAGAKAIGGTAAEGVAGLLKQDGRSTTTKEAAPATAFTGASVDATADADATNAAFTAAAAAAATATTREVCPPAVAAAAAESSCKFGEPWRGCSSSIREGVAPVVGGLVRLLAPGCYCLTVNGIVDQQGQEWCRPLQQLPPASTLGSSSKGNRSRGEAGSSAVQRPVLLLKRRSSCEAAGVHSGDGGAATAATAAAAPGGESGGSGSAG